MNCLEFETLVTDLACDRLMDAMTRRRLLAHTDTCLACARRLEEEKTLSSGLSALAATTENLEADPRLKTELLAALAELHAPAPRFVLKEVPRSREPRRWLLAAAAALVLTVLGASSIYWRFSRTGPDMAVSHPTPARQTPARIEPTPTPTPVPATETAPVPERNYPKPRLRPSTIRSVGSPALASVTSTETTTDYMPLTYLSDATALQSGVVVRVEIPRSTLLAMGLPMNSERGNSLVKADVVLGDDGVARAIRLVR